MFEKKTLRIANINVSIHWSLWLFLAWIAVSALSRGEKFVGTAYCVLLVVAIFACVLLHELGHALAARQLGISTRGITLLPIGGIASLERMPQRPCHELWIAVAGPLVNVAIVMVLGLTLTLFTALPSPVEPTLFVEGISHLMWINVVLVLFNMLPAFPMDGGRIFRSTLALVVPYTDATRWAAAVGKFLAICMGLVGLFTNPMLIFVATFVFLTGSAEARMVSEMGHFHWKRPVHDDVCHDTPPTIFLEDCHGRTLATFKAIRPCH